MKTKTKRFNFAFDKETDDMIRLLAEKTGLKFITVVKQGIFLLAKEKGVEK